jgi:hypothetical protein
MRNKNNTNDPQTKNETALNEDTLIFVISAAIVSFALGFGVASALAAAKIAAMLAG